MKVKLCSHGSGLGSCVPGSGRIVSTRTKEVPHNRIPGRMELRAWCRFCSSWTGAEAILSVDPIDSIDPKP